MPGPTGFYPLPTIRQTQKQRRKQRRKHIIHFPKDDSLSPSWSSSSFSPSSLGTVLPTPVLLWKSSTAGLRFSSTKSSDIWTCPFRYLVFRRIREPVYITKLPKSRRSNAMQYGEIKNPAFSLSITYSIPHSRCLHFNGCYITLHILDSLVSVESVEENCLLNSSSGFFCFIISAFDLYTQIMATNNPSSIYMRPSARAFTRLVSLHHRRSHTCNITREPYSQLTCSGRLDLTVWVLKSLEWNGFLSAKNAAR